MKNFVQLIATLFLFGACASSQDGLDTNRSSDKWIAFKCHSDTKINEQFKDKTLSFIESVINRDPVFKINIEEKLYNYQGFVSYFVEEKPNTATFGIGLPNKKSGYVNKVGTYVELNHVDNKAFMRFMVLIENRDQFDKIDPNSIGFMTAANLDYNCQKI